MFNHVQGKQFGRVVNNALVLNSDHALGRATMKVLDHHRVAIETLHATVKPGETRVAIKDKRIDGVFVELGDFRDFVVADGNGGIHVGHAPARAIAEPAGCRPGLFRDLRSGSEQRRRNQGWRQGFFASFFRRREFLNLADIPVFGKKCPSLRSEGPARSD